MKINEPRRISTPFFCWGALFDVWLAKAYSPQKASNFHASPVAGHAFNFPKHSNQ